MLFLPITANAQAPTYGTATVNDNINEWDLTNDFFADMYRAGNPTKKVQAKLYLRYDCTNQVMYALVLQVDNIPALVQNGEAFIKIGGNTGTEVDDQDNNDGTPPDFAWIDQGYDGDNGHARGFEASFSIAPGNHTIQAHVNSFDDGEEQTSSTGFASNDRFIPLEIDCSGNQSCSINVNSATAGECDPNTNTYSLEVSVTYANAPGGDITITTDNGGSQSFTPAGASGTETFTLTGLASNGVADIDVTAAFDNDNNCTHTATDAYDAPADCTPQCSITVNSASAGECDPNTNTYSLEVSVTYANAPGGDITITTDNGGSQSFTPAGTSGTETFTLTGLTSSGVANIDVTATFDNDNNCTHTATDAYNAPADCTPNPAKIGDFVWEDLDGDGVQDDGEPGIQGATVQLCDENGNPVQDLNGNSSVQTGTNGEYCFDVDPGTYIVKFPTPNGFNTCEKDAGNDDAVDSDYDPTNNNQTDPVTVGAGETNNDIDACFYRPAKLGNFVWIDDNDDGIFQNTELPLPGTTVILCDANGNPVSDLDGNGSLTTDANGEYCFNVKPGSYTLKFLPPFGYETCPKDAGDDDNVDSDYDPDNNNQTDPVTIASNEVNNTIDGCFKIPNDPMGYIYCESTGEIITGGLVEVTGPGAVNLIADGSLGYYQFTTDGTPGVYTISLTNPAGYQRSTTCLLQDPPAFDPPAAPNPFHLGNDEDTNNPGFLTSNACTNFYMTFDLAPGDPVIQTNNFPLICPEPSKLGNFVWNDANQNGVFDNGELPIENVKVNLLDANGDPVQDTNGNSTVFTDANGEYCFFVDPGDYIIEFCPPTPGPGEIVIPCEQDQGNDDELDSDYDPTTGRTDVVTIGAGETNNSIDGCFFICDEEYIYAFTDEEPEQIVRFQLDDPDGTYEVINDAVFYVGTVVGGQDPEGFFNCEPVDNLRGAACVKTDDGLKVYVITTKSEQGTIFEVDPTSGFAYSVVNLQTAGGEDVDNIRSLAWCDDDDMFYGVQKSTNLLVKIDPTTGITTYFSQPVTEEDRQVEGLSFRNEGGQKVLYGIDEDDGDVYTIDYLGTGEGTLVCTIDEGGFTTIDFGLDGTVYVGNRKDGGVYTLDLNTCETTLISGGLDLGKIQGIAYKPCPVFDLPDVDPNSLPPGFPGAGTGGGTTTGTNMALNMSASASSSDGDAPGNSVDGDEDSYWRSDEAQDGIPEWLQVDLGMNETVGAVVIKWESKNYAEIFDVQLSTDGSSWTTVASMTRDDKGEDEISFAQVTARYVRVYMTQGRKDEYKIAELEVYENPLAKRAVLADDEEIEEFAPIIPDAFVLHQNYPNPFNPSTMIRFELPEAGTVRLAIYNTAGQLVRTLVNGDMSPGVHQMTWDARDDQGQQVTSGLYLYRIEANGKVAMKKMTLMK